MACERWSGAFARGERWSGPSKMRFSASGTGASAGAASGRTPPSSWGVRVGVLLTASVGDASSTRSCGDRSFETCPIAAPALTCGPPRGGVRLPNDRWRRRCRPKASQAGQRGLASQRPSDGNTRIRHSPLPLTPPTSPMPSRGMAGSGAKHTRWRSFSI
jgi:hypothetical protein